MENEVHYLEIANHPIIFVLAAFVILVVLAQSLLFIRKAYNRGKELEMDDKVLKRAMTNSALLSIVPSLPIIVMMLALAVPLGQYFPWLRLSIVGSAIYEGTAANIAAQSQGLSDISDPNLTPTIFIIIIFVMTIGIIWGIVFNIFFMKRLDKFIKKTRNKSTSGFVPIFSAALFTALLVTLSTPYVGDTENISSIIAFVTAGIAVLLCNYLAKRYQKNLLRDFSLPIAMLTGMFAVIIQANLF